MIIAEKIAEIENKHFEKLSESELLLLNYWNTYKEANLYYGLMVACIRQNLPDLGLSYAGKGKLAATQALALQSKLKLNEAVSKFNDFAELFKTQETDLNDHLEGVTKTIHHLETKGEFGNVIQIIPEAKPKDKSKDTLEAVRAKLAASGLKVKENATPAQAANVGLKILDNLLLTGQISQKVYNQKCREIMLKKPKSA
jgi:hypothetical protein